MFKLLQAERTRSAPISVLAPTRMLPLPQLENGGEVRAPLAQALTPNAIKKSRSPSFRAQQEACSQHVPNEWPQAVGTGNGTT